MGEVVGQLLAPAVGVALSPLPIVGVILMLVSPRAKVNGPAFVLGWLAGMAIVIGLVLIFADPAKLTETDDSPSTTSGIIHLALGALLLILAVKQWRSRPKDGQEPAMPKWMAGIDKMTPIVALGLGAFLSGVNPKNLILDIAAGTAIVAADLSSTQQIAAAAIFMIIASVSVAVPVIWFLLAGDGAKGALDRLRVWLVQNNAAIMAVMFLVFGASLIGKALPAFFD